METDPLVIHVPSNGSTISGSSPSTPATPPLVMLTLPISTKFDRDNYLSWQSQIVPLLHAGLYRFLDSTIAHSATIPTDADSTISNPAFLPWY